MKRRRAMPFLYHSKLLSYDIKMLRRMRSSRKGNLLLRNTARARKSRERLFVHIAKELAYEEKKIFAARLGWKLDRDGNIYDLKQCVISTIVVLGCFGTIYCKIEGWNIKNMFEGMAKFVFSIILGATFLELPIILLGKKYSWSSRTKTILGLIIAFLLLIGSCIANYYAHHPL